MNKSVLKKLFSEKEQSVELSEVQKVELFNIEDTKKLYQKGLQDLKDADAEKAKVAQMYSRALIVLEMNVPAQLDDSIKKLTELGISDKAAELKSLKSEALKKASEYAKVYNSLK